MHEREEWGLDDVRTQENVQYLTPMDEFCKNLGFFEVVDLCQIWFWISIVDFETYPHTMKSQGRSFDTLVYSITKSIAQEKDRGSVGEKAYMRKEWCQGPRGSLHYTLVHLLRSYKCI